MSISVVLGGSDITPRLLGAVTVTRKERTAATAAFEYKPAGTPDLPTTLVGKPVVISWSGTTLHTGRVSDARWDVKNRLYQITTTDRLQEHFEALDTPAILAAIPGSLYSENVFGERQDGWRVALDCMSTVPLDVFMDVLGVQQTASWAAKVTPDFTLTASEILNEGAYQLNLAPSRELLTQYKSEYGYRVSRWKFRTHAFSWSYLSGDGVATDWCDWAQFHGYDMPTREMVIDAAEGTNWIVVTGTGWVQQGETPGFSFETHPPSGVYCADINWVVQDETRRQVVVAASWDGLRKWAQTITETYELTLNLTARQGDLGVVVGEDSANFDVEVDDASFESSPSQDNTGFLADTIGDFVQDQESEVDRVNDLQVMLEKGYTEVYSGYRGNAVVVEALLMATLDLSHTVEIDTRSLAPGGIHARGKVGQIVHTVTDALAKTQITVVITNGGGGVSDPRTVPTRPDTAPAHSAPSPSTTLLTRAGGCDNSPDYDETWDGWTTNNLASGCSNPGGVPTPEQIYPYRFKVTGPDIEDEARDEVTATSQTTYSVAVPDDLLVLT